jgi:spore coat protein CotH
VKLAWLLLLVAACEAPPRPPSTTCGAGTDGIHDICLVASPADWTLLNADPLGSVEIPVDLVLDGQHLPGAAIELHGGYARTVPKKSYRLRFADDAVPLPLFDGTVEEHKRVVLQAAYIDPTFLRNAVMFELVRAAGGLAPRLEFARVYVNGERLGLFQMIERIDKHWLRRHGLPDDPATLYKAEGNAADWGPAADPMEGLEQEVGEPSDDLAQLLAAVNHAPLSTEGFAAEVEPVLDVDDVLIYQRIHTLAMDRDAYSKNYYLYHDLAADPDSPEARFRLVTWDADATFCQRWDGVPLPPDGTTDDRWHGWDVLSGRLFAIPSYQGVYVSDYRTALDGELATAAILERIDRLAALIGPEARLDLARWQPELDWDTELARLRACVAARNARMRTILP